MQTGWKLTAPNNGRSLRGNVDRNHRLHIAAAICICRSLRGNVDRNCKIPDYNNSIHVVPYVGTWIEIRIPSFSACPHPVVPYVGTWIEIFLDRIIDEEGRGRSLRGNVDRNMESGARRTR